MKITFVRHSLLSRGGDKMILAHAAHLAAEGHEVVIQSSVIDSIYKIDERIIIKKNDSRSKFKTIISCLTRSHDSDWLIADIIPIACLLYFRNRNRVLYFSQDYDESYYSNTLKKYFIRTLYILGLSWFKIPVIAVATHLKETLEHRFGAKVSVVTNGVDLDTFFPDPDADLKNKKNGRKAILVLSRSDWRKGFDIARRVIKKLIDESAVPFEVWSVGEPSSGCFSNVIHRDFGYVREEELRRIVSSADIFLYPSRHEGFPLMALEAMACGCSMVTTAAVSVVKPQVEALVSPIEDVESLSKNIIVLLKDESLRISLVDAGIKFSFSNSLRDSCRKFSKKLSELLEK